MAGPRDPLAPATVAAYEALAAGLAERRAGVPGRALVVGLCGAQGSGKSTAAAFLAQRLDSAHGLRTAILSLDDFYLPRAQRQALADLIHPLFVTRGVPGTHEVALGVAVLEALRDGRGARWPRFDKAQDDRAPASEDHACDGPVGVLLFEGWCVGLPPEDPAALDTPVNALERDEDSDGRWRRAVHARLAGDYAAWFARLDVRVLLAVPDFAAVHRWRGEQERDTARAAGTAATALQDPGRLARFIQHYERLTAHALRVLPVQADAVLRLDADHAVRGLHWNRRP